MSWAGLASNQFVSFTDAQGSGFTQLVSLPTSNQFMDKVDALYYLNLDSSYMSGITDDQFPQKSLFVAGAAAPTVNNDYYYAYSGNCFNSLRISNGYTTFPAGFASYKLYRDGTLIHTQSSKPYDAYYDFFYNDTGATIGTGHAYVIRLTDSVGQYTDTTTKYANAVECNPPTIWSAIGVSRRTYNGSIEIGIGYDDIETTCGIIYVQLIGVIEGYITSSGLIYLPTPLSQHRYDSGIYWSPAGMTIGRTYHLDLYVFDSNGNSSDWYTTQDFVW